MTVLIEDAELVTTLRRMAADSGKSVDETVGNALNGMLHAVPTETQGRRRSPEEFFRAIRKIQDAYAAIRDPDDHRTPDEIIGYNEHGHFD